MNIVRKITAVVLTCLVVLPVAGCNNSRKLIELVPDGVSMVAEIQVNDIVRAWRVYSAVKGNEATVEWFEQAKDEFRETSGLEMDDISEVLLFAAHGDVPTDGMPAYAGGIVNGKLDGDRTIENISRATGLTFDEEPYGEFTIHLSTDGEKAAAFLTGSVMVMGSPEAVKNCLDVAQGDGAPVSGQVLNMYTSLGSGVMRMAMVVPDASNKPTAEVPDITAMMIPGLQVLSEIETLGTVVTMDAQKVTVDNRFGFPATDTADKAAKAMKAVMSLFSLAGESDAADLAERIEITAVDTAVRFSCDLTYAELTEMLDAFEEMKDVPQMPGFVFPEGIPDFGEFDFSSGSSIPESEVPENSGMPNPEIPELRVMPTPDIAANSNMPEVKVPEGRELR